jgi:hypothetical protein
VNTDTKLPSRSIRARNFAEASDNKMHSDETAAQYGFRGGLVPGVGVYAYLTIPAAEIWGEEWLCGGTMWAKFLKPVYDAEIVHVHARYVDKDTIEAEVINETGTSCATGRAHRTGASAPPGLGEFGHAPAPAREARRAPEIAACPRNTTLGSIEFQALNEALRGESGELFLDDVRDPLPLYRRAGAPLHPAVYPARANSLVMANVALGPWIHTESAAQHFAIPARGDAVSVRGRIQDAFEKRGHVFIVVDCAFFSGETTLARVLHTAIMKPALATA